MSDCMTLKDACRRHGLAYHRAWYLLARGRVQAEVVGRTWQITDQQAEALKRLLDAKKPAGGSGGEPAAFASGSSSRFTQIGTAAG